MSFRLLPKFTPRDSAEREAELERRFLRMEAEIGGKLFGPVPQEHRRQFFCLDERTWIWHEEWLENGQRKVVTTRYTVRPEGVTKSQNGQGDRWLSRDEARNLRAAVIAYQQRVNEQYQRILQPA